MSTINLNHLLDLRGECTVTARSVFNGQVISVNTYTNTIFSRWKIELAKDLAGSVAAPAPVVMGFSKDVVAVSPVPTALTNEFRASISTYSSSNTLQIIAVLPSYSGNATSGNIKSMGFYYGTDATLTVGTGSLGSLINTLDEPKTSSIELTFQYDITFG